MRNAKRSIPAALATALLAGACGPREPQEDPRALTETAKVEPWLLCDAINQPVLLIGHRAKPSGAMLITVYSKAGESAAQTLPITLGVEEGAAGSVYRALLRDGTNVGHVRTLNPGMLEDPNDAYTAPVASVRMNSQDYSCRWLARTRFAGFTARRSIFITQDADGDLIYQTFDFADAAASLDLGEGQRSTLFSVEVRDGRESTTPDGQTFAFENDGYRYEIWAPNAAQGRLSILRDGREVQSEPFIAFQTGPR
jgi:hypothetical protein